jgi:hypothetical protein
MPADYSTRSGAYHAAKIRAGLAAAKAKAEAEGRQLPGRSGTVSDAQRKAIALCATRA